MYDTPLLAPDFLVLLQCMPVLQQLVLFLYVYLSVSTSWHDVKIYKGHILFVFSIPLDLERFLWKHLPYNMYDGILDIWPKVPKSQPYCF